jgi:hypothetical protein
MRKLKRESNIIYRKGIIAIIERIKNDNNGNPRYQVQFINENELTQQQTSHQTTCNNQYYSIVSYNVELDVENFIDNNIIENYQ